MQVGRQRGGQAEGGALRAATKAGLMRPVMTRPDGSTMNLSLANPRLSKECPGLRSNVTLALGLRVPREVFERWYFARSAEH